MSSYDDFPFATSLIYFIIVPTSLTEIEAYLVRIFRSIRGGLLIEFEAEIGILF
jgi:hypothetical protein